MTRSAGRVQPSMPPPGRRPPEPAPPRVLPPPDLEDVRRRTWDVVRQTPGYLSEREARFLMMAAACAPAGGATVEIGSFKGRSTVALAAVARRYGLGPIVAVDPHTAPSPTDPALGGLASTFDDFLANLRAAGVEDAVEPHREYSRDLAAAFDRRIRLLWIDGDHTVAGARDDLRLFLPFLEPGAIVAMHDVLGTWEGSLRVFCEDILASDKFGPAGFCGSIGWAQFRPADGARWRYRLRRALLAFPARRLIPVAASGHGLVGFNKYRYKIWRPLAPHGDAAPEHWVGLTRM